MTSARHHLLLILGVFSLSTAAVLLRLYTGHPLTVVGWRLILAALFLTPWAIPRLGELRALPGRATAGLIGSGAALAAHFTLWVYSLRLTSVASAVTLVCLQPVFAFIGESILGRRPAPRLFVPLSLALAGAAFMAGFDRALGGGRLLGDLLALAGAWAISIYWLLGRSLRQRLDLIPYTWSVYGIAGLILLGAAVLVRAHLLPPAPGDLLAILLLALIPTLAGHSICNWALKELPASTVSTYILGEPVGSTVLAAFLLHEPPGWRSILGGLAVLAGLAWFFRWEGAPVPGEEGSPPRAAKYGEKPRRMEHAGSGP